MRLMRFKFRVALGSIPILTYYIPFNNYRIKHIEKYKENQLFKWGCQILSYLKFIFSTKTQYFGLENIPEDGGFIMYANHQGKYDGFGIVLAMKRPVSVLWDVRSAGKPLTKQISRLLMCEVIDTSKKQNFIPCMERIAEIVKNGKPYLIFPEGGYTDNKNTLQEFQTGCFMTSTLSKTPVVPVVLYDSYKSMDGNRLFGGAKTQVHFLKPITHEEYQSMNRKSLCALVKERIQKKLDEINESYSE